MFRSCEPPPTSRRPHLPVLVPMPPDASFANGGGVNDEDDGDDSSSTAAAAENSVPEQPVVRAAANNVPSSVKLSRELRHYRKQVLGIPLQRICMDKGNNSNKVTADPKAVQLRDVLALEAANNAKTTNDVVSVVFCVRRPGCSACRENGQLLSELAATTPNVSLWGIVKETGVDDAGLRDFADTYFSFPLYQDKKWLIYAAMGNRKISLWGLLTGIFKSSTRLRKKNIATTMAGEGWIQGGVLVFNAKHQLVYALEENFGNELNVGDIKLAIEAARKEC